MSLMERVATLLRANIHDLLERAEDPQKLLRQLLLDMENQLLQVKTQVAIALTDQHLLEGRAKTQKESAADWHRKAELAVKKGDDALARAALERAVRHETLLAALQAQVAHQASEAEAVRASYTKLQSKLLETRGRCDVLIAEHRRARMLRMTAEAGAWQGNNGASPRSRVDAQSSEKRSPERVLATQQFVATDDSLQERFDEIERDERVEELLAELKQRTDRLPAAG